MLEIEQEHALTVLRALRLVLAWTRGPEAAFSDPEALASWEAQLRGAPLQERLRTPLVALIAGLRLRGRANAAAVAQACLALNEWAREVGAEDTALLFAEAAALAWPINARNAWVVGRMLRNAGRSREGELWLRRSMRVAVWTADWETQDLALNSLGNLYAQQGAFSQALEYLTRALGLARRHRMKEREGAVAHDLFTVFMFVGEHARAEDLAVSAFDLYGADHPNLPKLAHDVVQLWLRQGRFPLALPVLRALLPFLRLPHERVRVLASTARAAGACGDRTSYEEAWAEGFALVHEHQHAAEVRRTLPAVLVDFGHGAASLSEWKHAAEAFTLALEFAKERGAHEDAANAETGLEMVRRYERIETPRRRMTGPAAQLSDAFVRSLEDAAPKAVVVGGGAT